MTPHPETDTDPTIDPHQLQELAGAVGQDNVVRLLGDMARKITATVASIETALGQDDLKAAAFDAHKLTGSAATLSLQAMTNAARDLETAVQTLSPEAIAPAFDRLRTVAAASLNAIADYLAGVGAA